MQLSFTLRQSQELLASVLPRLGMHKRAVAHPDLEFCKTERNLSASRAFAFPACHVLKGEDAVTEAVTIFSVLEALRILSPSSNRIPSLN